MFNQTIKAHKIQSPKTLRFGALKFIQSLIKYPHLHISRCAQ